MDPSNPLNTNARQTNHLPQSNHRRHKRRLNDRRVIKRRHIGKSQNKPESVQHHSSQHFLSDNKHPFLNTNLLTPDPKKDQTFLVNSHNYYTDNNNVNRDLVAPFSSHEDAFSSDNNNNNKNDTKNKNDNTANKNDNNERNNANNNENNTKYNDHKNNIDMEPWNFPPTELTQKYLNQMSTFCSHTLLLLLFFFFR